MSKLGFFILIIFLLLVGCLGLSKLKEQHILSKEKHQSKVLSILCTTNIIEDTVKRLVNDKAEVYCLMGPGVDPHTYRARENDMYRLLNADIIFYNGLHLEGKMGAVFEKIKQQNKRVIALGDALDHRYLLTTNYENIYDPHIWHDVMLWKKVVTIIVQVLKEVDTMQSSFYDKQGHIYGKELDELHEYIHEKVRNIKPSYRCLITAHDAFQYFAREYGLEVIGLQGVSTDSEISPRNVHDLVQCIIERKIPAIFIESSLPQRNIQSVIDAVRMQGHTVSLGGELFSDALAGKNHNAGTYLGMMKHNINTIVQALT